MALRITIGAALAIIAFAVAFIADRRSRSANRARPVVADRDAPTQLHRGDFVRPDAPWLVVIFTSAACGGCGPMAAKVAVLESAIVATAEVEFGEHEALHKRYAVDAVPLVVVADSRGVVRKSYFGTTSATDLWAALAELRSAPAGSSAPEPTN